VTQGDHGIELRCPPCRQETRTGRNISQQDGCRQLSASIALSFGLRRTLPIVPFPGPAAWNPLETRGENIYAEQAREEQIPSLFVALP